eukprot:TRINITY_DN13394_c0_g1_i2.p3 TRINITY_DN13394_c0_g1~~TRINITY_DN13394_c0_g1_i2.p3  ORF type:complete len:105 (+),score=15.20 TRINITY_DN13394_c0_g1_i2:107-421(+)
MLPPPPPTTQQGIMIPMLTTAVAIPAITTMAPKVLSEAPLQLRLFLASVLSLVPLSAGSSATMRAGSTWPNRHMTPTTDKLLATGTTDIITGVDTIIEAIMIHE